MRTRSSLAILGLILLLAGCGDEVSGPSAQEEPIALAIDAPAVAVAGAAVEIRVTAHGADATRPLASAAGTVELMVSSGTVTPAAVQMSAGVAVADVRITAVGAVTLQATLGNLSERAPLQVLAAGQLLPGDPDDPAETAIPDLRYVARIEDYDSNRPDLSGVMASFNTIIVVFEPGTTVAQANALLTPLDAEIVGGVRGVAGTVPGILFLRLPVTSHAALGALIEPLRNSPAVRVVVQDALLQAAVDAARGVAAAPVPDDDGAAADWTWEIAPTGGNWGLELSRVPQMWSLNRAIVKRLGEATYSPPVTGVLDGGFAAHPDLPNLLSIPAGTFTQKHVDHGVHVTGTIGAGFDNGQGIDGINPYTHLRAYPTGAGTSWSFFDFLDASPGMDVVNISLEFGWTSNPASSPATQQLVQNLGNIFVLWQRAHTARGGTLPFLVVAAGNHSGTAQGDFDAKWTSPFAYAALELGVVNVLVVEAVQQSGGATGGASRAAFSDRNGHLSAPGVNILSTSNSQPYAVLQGTSMAAPHVTGLASYMLALDPTLSHTELRDLLLRNAVAVGGGASPRMDAFPTVLDIDAVNGDDRVLRMLVDFDDGTEDGNLRTDPDGGFADFTMEDADGDGEIGDGRVDMSDFRRWRDHLLFFSFTPDLMLDGSGQHPKKDLNGDGQVGAVADERVYPRADLNGDFFVDAANPAPVPGAIGREVTDLEVLQELFDDPHYPASDLPALLVSADIAIRPAALLENPDVVDIHSSIRPTGDAAAADDVRSRRIHTGSADDGEGLWQVYTVPASGDSYIGRVVGIDAQGDTIFDDERSFTVLPGEDEFWDPKCLSTDGNLTLRTQADVDAASRYCAVGGQLYVRQEPGSSDPITSLAPLASLEQVLHLEVSGTDLTDLSGLEHLSISQGGAVRIISNPALTTLAPLGDGVGTVASEFYGISIVDNLVLADISALANLMAPGTTVTEHLEVSYNPALPSLAGLEEVQTGKTINIIDNVSMTSTAALAGLQEAEWLQFRGVGASSLDLSPALRLENLHISENPALTQTSYTFAAVTNHISIDDNPVLPVMTIHLGDGSPTFSLFGNDQITSISLSVASGTAAGLTVGGELLRDVNVNGLVITHQLQFYTTGVTTVSSFGAMTSLSGPLRFINNAALTDIDNLSGLQSVGSLQIINNPELCVPDWVHDLEVQGGDVIRDNQCN